MKKIIRKIGLCMIVSLFIVGCSNQNQLPIEYSNLNDQESKNEVFQLLKKHKISQNQIDQLNGWIEDFNSRVDQKELTKSYQPMKKLEVNYQNLVLKDKETEDGYVLPETNCRLTSYLLMKNFIQTNGKEIKDDTILMFDLEAVDLVEQFHLTKEERKEYTTFYNWISVKGTKSIQEHEKKIKEAWRDRQIKVNGNNISFIEVYIHSPFDEVRFIGHIGVLLELEDQLLFIEKYGPFLPFQATKFNNRNELKKYLLNRKDFYGDEKELAPIVMENEQVI